jgi:hypothetical protein
MKRILAAFILLNFVCIKLSGQTNTGIAKIYIYRNLAFGTWFPDNKNRVLGQPLIAGVSFGIKYNLNSYAINFDLIAASKTKEPIKIKFGDSLLTRNDYFGAQLTVDYGREFWSKERFSFEGICGFGWGTLTYYNPNKDINIDKSSLVLEPGVSFRYLIGKKLFLQFKAQYCVANYALKDNVSTSFKGNYLITKLVFGSRRNHV